MKGSAKKKEKQKQTSERQHLDTGKTKTKKLIHSQGL